MLSEGRVRVGKCLSGKSTTRGGSSAMAGRAATHPCGLFSHDSGMVGWHRHSRGRCSEVEKSSLISYPRKRGNSHEAHARRGTMEYGVVHHDIARERVRPGEGIGMY